MSLCALWILELCIIIEVLRHGKTGQIQEQESAAEWLITLGMENKSPVTRKKMHLVEDFYSKP